MINFIVARSKNNVIGRNGGLPWNLPNDLRYFREITDGRIIVMGRKTFDSIGKALPGRKNVVLTRDINFYHPDVTVIHDMLDIHKLGDVFVIGGASLFDALKQYVFRMYITDIDMIVSGDTFFPSINMDEFVLSSATSGVIDARNQLPHVFNVYERKMFHDEDEDL